MDANTIGHKIVFFLSALSGPVGYAAILGMLLICGLGVPIPEDITLLAAGIMAALKSISLPGALAVGFVGVLTGDAFMFFLGKVYGKKAFKFPVIRTILTPERIQLAEQKIRRNSKFICFTARFLPGLRSPVFLTAGAMGVSPLTFFTLDGFAALISVPVWIFLGHWFGENIDQALKVAKEIQLFIFVGLVLIIGGYFIYKKKMAANAIQKSKRKKP